MPSQTLSRFTGRTTVILTPATTRIRFCAKHHDRKATAVKVIRGAARNGAPAYTGYVPACPECSQSKQKHALGAVSAILPL